MSHDQGISRDYWAKGFSPDRLRLVILPTEKCNFRCTYCYEDFSIGRMSPEVREGLVKFLARRKDDLRLLDIDWFGGEPLLYAGDILDVMAQVRHIFQPSSSTSIRASVTTNGYLLNKKVSRDLIGVSVNQFLITLDGNKDIHDRRRVHLNGAGTFDTIFGNIQYLLDSELDFKLTLRIHYDRASIQSTFSFVHDVIAPWAQDRRVAIVFAHLENLSLSQKYRVTELNEVERQEVVAELAKLVPRSFAKETQPYVCYAAQPNAFVIRADGLISKCTVALSDPLNHVGRLSKDGELLLNEGHSNWLSGWFENDINKLACPYAGIVGKSSAWSSTI